MSERLMAAFPGLRSTQFRITSPPDSTYNCIAWSAADTSNWWWPHAELHRSFWPSGVRREVTCEVMTAVFETLDYVLCSDESLEPGFEKVALFVNATGAPTHAARQLSTGRWTSKLGQSEDIEHELRALEGEIYGTVGILLRRQVKRKE